MINCVSNLVPAKCVQNNKSDVSFGMTKIVDPKSLKVLDELDHDREFKHLGNYAARILKKEFHLTDVPPEKQNGDYFIFESDIGDKIEYNKAEGGKLIFHSKDFNPKKSKTFVTETDGMDELLKHLYDFIIDHLL